MAGSRALMVSRYRGSCGSWSMGCSEYYVSPHEPWIKTVFRQCGTECCMCGLPSESNLRRNTMAQGCDVAARPARAGPAHDTTLQPTCELLVKHIDQSSPPHTTKWLDRPTRRREHHTRFFFDWSYLELGTEIWMGIWRDVSRPLTRLTKTRRLTTHCGTWDVCRPDYPPKRSVKLIRVLVLRCGFKTPLPSWNGLAARFARAGNVFWPWNALR